MTEPTIRLVVMCPVAALTSVHVLRMGRPPSIVCSVSTVVGGVNGSSTPAQLRCLAVVPRVRSGQRCQPTALGTSAI
jgi:hypothetical protein